MRVVFIAGQYLLTVGIYYQPPGSDCKIAAIRGRRNRASGRPEQKDRNADQKEQLLSRKALDSPAIQVMAANIGRH
jgi:hypothetical protein